MKFLVVGSPEGARVNLACAQMELAIAEAADSVAKRVESNRAKARQTASSFRTAAESLERLMNGLSSEAPESYEPGAEIVPIFRATECLALVGRPFLASFESFQREYGDLVEPSLKSTLERFPAWADAEVEKLRPMWTDYIGRLEGGLAEAAEAEAQTAAEWSSVDEEWTEERGSQGAAHP